MTSEYCASFDTYCLGDCCGDECCYHVASIIGIILALLIVITIIIACVYYYIRRQKDKKKAEHEQARQAVWPRRHNDYKMHQYGCPDQKSAIFRSPVYVVRYPNIATPHRPVHGWYVPTGNYQFLVLRLCDQYFLASILEEFRFSGTKRMALPVSFKDRNVLKRS